MSKSHAIQVPQKLAQELWLKLRDETASDFSDAWHNAVTRAAQWGWDQREPEIQQAADQMLDACCDWVSKYLPYLGDFLRAAMRPKSLVEQGLEILSPPEGPVLAGTPEYRLTEFQAEVLRAALDRLDKLEAKQ